MTRPFVVVFNDLFADASEVQRVLDTIPAVSFWYRCFPDAIFVTSALSADDLSSELRSRIELKKEGGRVFVAEIDQRKTQGWMPKAAWHLINNPENPRLP